MNLTSTCRPNVIGLTGGIAAGKSTVRAAFERLGVPCADIDGVARTIHQDPMHPATQAIAKVFPDWMTADGALQRGSLVRLFARDARANRTLVDLLQPHVLARVHHWTQAQCARYVVWESALLRQEGIEVDRLLVVDAPVALRHARMRRRNPDWSDAQVANILAMQLAPPGASCALPGDPANDAICNDGSAQDLQQQVEAMHLRYTQLWK